MYEKPDEPMSRLSMMQTARQKLSKGLAPDLASVSTSALSVLRLVLYLIVTVAAFGMIVLEEEERLDRAKVTFLAINRYRIEDGNESVILAYQQLIDKHQESKNRYSYKIALGDFYFMLAQEYSAQNDPESLRFETAIFEALGQAALRHYAAVAQEDGIVEKLEAKGKLEALEAYMAKIGRLGR